MSLFLYRSLSDDHMRLLQPEAYRFLHGHAATYPGTVDRQELENVATALDAHLHADL